MVARVYSCAVIGLDGVIVEVEVDYAVGFGGMIVVGLPDAAVQESRERVQSAVKNAAFVLPRRRVIANLAPASVRKEDPSYDLPIAIGVLLLTNQFPAESLESSLVISELSLDGSVRHVRGILPMAGAAHQNGYKQIFAPAVDAAEAALIPDLEVIPVNSLSGAHIIPAQIPPILEDAIYGCKPISGR
jgi:magnesium chelatase family protein